MSWNNVQDDCMLCEMDKRTEWYYENEHLVVAEKLGGGPFVVWKEHKEELHPQEAGYVEGVVNVFFGEDVELKVMMNIVEDHWHSHILGGEFDPDLSGE